MPMFISKIKIGVIFVLKPAEKARKELNGELFKTKSGGSRPIRICKYEVKGNNDINPHKNLLVRNLDKSVTAKDFYKSFQIFGEIKSSKLETNEFGESKGFGYVYYYNVEDAEKAIKEMVNFLLTP
jgi:RNA recognition motif-containing protein